MARYVLTLSCEDRPGIVHTAHFVTADLDEGPIIDQDTVRISHADSAERLAAIGRDVESRVLASAVRAFAEHRVFLDGSRTVVFP